MREFFIIVRDNMTQFINTQRGSKWEPWERGLPWASINSAAFDWNDIVYWLTDWSTVRLVDWKTELTWPQWEPWEPWQDWQDWAAATVTVWSTTTWLPWTSASVTNSGTTSAAVLNFTIPQWANWQDWQDGQDWAAATITAWTATWLPAGSSPTVTNSGSSSAAVFNFWIPAWATGATGNWIASVTSSKSWKVTTVTITETDWDSSSFQVSDWEDWEWAWDVLWPSSATDWHLAVFDWVTWKLIKDWWAVPAAQIQSDWEQSDNTKVDFIKNKPSIPAAQVNSDWNSNSWVSQILNKPTLWTAASKNTGTSSWNVPVLDANGKLDNSVLPAVALVDTFTVTNKADLTSLSSADQWDIGIVTSESKTYVLSQAPYSTAANWKELLTPTDAVTSVNTKTWAVTLDADDISDSTTTNKFVTATEKSTWNWKQNALATQTAYTSKGSATKVPQITTNTLWQVTWITEVTITQPTVPTNVSDFNNDAGYITSSSLPWTATSSTTWTVKLWSDTTQSVSANAVSWTASRTYAIQTNSSDQLVVNVPWEDHTYTASSFDIKDLADSTGLRTTWSWKQDALSSQTAYTTKWTSTKVPTITTNTLGQVTAITETSIDFPVTSVNGSTWAITWLATTSDLSWKQDSLTLPVSPTQWNLVTWWSDNKTLVDGGAVPTGFNPASAWTTDQVLTKTANGYDWATPAASWIICDPNSPITIDKIRCGTEAQYSALTSYSEGTAYLTV